MAAVIESELFAAKQITMQTAVATIDTAKFAGTGSPTFEGSTTAFPNGRNEKFIDYNGSSQYHTVDLSTAISLDNGVLSFWIKPDFDQTYGTNKSLTSGYGTVFQDGFDLSFSEANDDWATGFYIDNDNKFNSVTVGETWTADSVLHFIFMWEKSAGLDNSKSFALYINGTLKITGTTTYSTTGDSCATTSRVGAAWDAGSKFDGGIYDYAIYNYSTLAASHTDAEIVQSIYSNTFNAGNHKFSFELQSAPIAPSGLYADTVGKTTCTLHWTDNSSDETGFKIYQDGVLIDTIAAGSTSYNVTGLTADTRYSFYVTAYNVGGASASSTIYVTTINSGITVKGRKGRLSNSTKDVLQWNSSGINYQVLCYQTVTSAYTFDSAGDKDFYIRANGTFTVTLPTAATYPGRVCIVKNIGTGTITCNSVGLDPGYSVTYISNGTTWEVLSFGATIA